MALQTLDMPAGGTAAAAGVPDAGSPQARRQDEMRRHLVAAAPSSGNEALRLLRSAFPHASLSERVEAAQAVSRYMV